MGASLLTWSSEIIFLPFCIAVNFVTDEYRTNAVKIIYKDEENQREGREASKVTSIFNVIDLQKFGAAQC